MKNIMKHLVSSNSTGFRYCLEILILCVMFLVPTVGSLTLLSNYTDKKLHASSGQENKGTLQINQTMLERKSVQNDAKALMSIIDDTSVRVFLNSVKCSDYFLSKYSFLSQYFLDTDSSFYSDMKSIKSITIDYTGKDEDSKEDSVVWLLKVDIIYTGLQNTEEQGSYLLILEYNSKNELNDYERIKL